jgi:GNAT superfamily N-acetyltransferase
MEMRHATSSDFVRILELTRRSLGWTDQDARYLVWKHAQNPFGASPMWIAETDGRVVGFRAFLRWEFVDSGDTVVRSVRAVDTATDPDYQGQGVFTGLTRTAVDELSSEGVAFVFNTPNRQSLPGYLKMGWQSLGRLTVAIRPGRLRFPFAAVTARRGADRGPLATSAGEDAAEVLAESTAIERLLNTLPRPLPRPSALATRRSPAYLAWRYGFAPLGYRALVAGDDVEAGLALFRLRRRGRAIEATVDELLVPGGDADVCHALLRGIARLARPDYLIRLASAAHPARSSGRLRGIGPVLACRPLAGSPPPELRDWALTMGDIELL